MQYSHRNGETLTPEVSGLYWFKGLFEGYDFEPAVIRVTVGDYPFPCLELVACDEPIAAQEFAGEWYGPLVSPWDKP